MASAAAVQLVFAIPHFIIMEWFPYWPVGCYDIVTDALKLMAKDGYLEAPTVSGLGVEFNMDYLARCASNEIA